MRRRSNLAIMPRTRAVGLRTDGAEVRGVVAERDGNIRQLDAREVILSAGAIHSPTIMLRAGIGPADQLKGVGIVPLVDRPGVGRNLQNHLYLHFALTLPRGRRLARHLRRFAIAGIRLSSGLAGLPGRRSDVVHDRKSQPALVWSRSGNGGAALYSPFSRGVVSLAGPDSATPPRIEFRVLEDARDPPRMLKAARFAETLLIDPGVAATYSEAYLLPPVMSLHQFNRPGVTGTLLALAAKAVLNAPAPCAASRSTTSSVPAAGSRTEMVGSRSRMLICWRRLLRWRTRPGPARSGAPTAPMRWSTTRAGSTASATCAWWMPRSCRGFLSANTNLPTLMIAHRAAELIRSGA